ncbi:prepilin peptidase [Dasania marina]|uniref:prepilin peptidase n=1 Tax=Dasania marina TaxID=471499 RepID=UPI00035CFA6E|nr:A24 family peptidase [Dasania marina]
MQTLIELYPFYPALLISGVVILGLLVGSFLNVVIYRLPVMMEKEWQSECRYILELAEVGADEKPEKFNLAFPNSHCPNCKKEIKPWQNIPVISYLLLKGKCARCQNPISLRYPIIEAVSGLLSGILIWQLGMGYELVAALLLTWALIALTMIDADTQLLPDQITLPLLWLGLICNAFGLYTSLENALWGAVFGYLSLWTVYWVFKLLTGKEGMGFGDFKLLAALGAWMGWQSLPIIILLSSLVGAIIGIALMLLNNKGRDTAIPFGPYLAIAGWIAFLWGDHITRSYLQFAGLQ